MFASCLLCLLGLTSFAHFALGLVKVVPSARSIPVGGNATFVCSSTLSPKRLKWMLTNNGTLENGEQSADGRFSNENGSLILRLLTIADSGSYYCADNKTFWRRGRVGLAVLKVFEMPSYQTEGIVVLIVNG
ncbi:unnamed protein product, partial [Dicrocoelium dendriticum]